MLYRVFCDPVSREIWDPFPGKNNVIIRTISLCILNFNRNLLFVGRQRISKCNEFINIPGFYKKKLFRILVPDKFENPKGLSITFLLPIVLDQDLVVARKKHRMKFFITNVFCVAAQACKHISTSIQSD